MSTAVEKAQPQTTAITAPENSTLAIAIKNGMPPETIGKLMDLQERWETNQARKAFVDAMANFKRECPAVIGKDRKADFGQGKAKYSYATTGAIVQAITPALSKYGLSLSWETKQEARAVTCTCHVTHSGGHRESATLTGPHDESGGKNPIQMIGSSVHYLQRYTMVSVLGLATADMDDPDENDYRPPVEMPRAKPATAQTPASGLQVATGTVEEIAEKTGRKKDGSTWTRWGIKVAGQFFGTFDAAVAQDAARAKEAGEFVTIEYTTDAKGFHTIANMTNGNLL
jgi:hypothetical protein